MKLQLSHAAPSAAPPTVPNIAVVDAFQNPLCGLNNLTDNTLDSNGNLPIPADHSTQTTDPEQCRGPPLRASHSEPMHCPSVTENGRGAHAYHSESGFAAVSRWASQLDETTFRIMPSEVAPLYYSVLKQLLEILELNTGLGRGRGKSFYFRSGFIYNQKKHLTPNFIQVIQFINAGAFHLTFMIEKIHLIHFWYRLIIMKEHKDAATHFQWW